MGQCRGSHCSVGAKAKSKNQEPPSQKEKRTKSNDAYLGVLSNMCHAKGHLAKAHWHQKVSKNRF